MLHGMHAAVANGLSCVPGINLMSGISTRLISGCAPDGPAMRLYIFTVPVCDSHANEQHSPSPSPIPVFEFLRTRVLNQRELRYSDCSRTLYLPHDCVTAYSYCSIQINP